MGELGSVQTCKRIFKEQISEQGDIPFYKNGTIGLEPDSYISREVYEEFRRLYPYPEVGDTLISVVGSIGRTAEYTGRAAPRPQRDTPQNRLQTKIRKQRTVC